jgi:pimeloyl-ACP methyl ester carboxylesterase
MADQALAPTDGYFKYSPAETIHWQEIGTGRRQIVFLHGFAASLHTWDDLATCFSPHDYTLHLLDLKGHGRSSKPSGGDYSARHNARIVTAYIRSRSLNDVLLVGHSFGGLVGLLTSQECPEVSCLVMLDSPCFPQALPRFIRILCLPVIGPLAMATIPVRTIARKGLESVFFRRERITARLIERYAAGYRGLSAVRALAYTARQLLPRDSRKMMESYSHVAVPTLIVWGQHDRVVMPWQGERLQGEVGGSRFIRIPDCGHNPHEEVPEMTYNIIRDFLLN